MSLRIGLIVGLVLGLTGAGGSIFVVPLLMVGLGFSITQAATVLLLGVTRSTASWTPAPRGVFRIELHGTRKPRVIRAARLKISISRTGAARRPFFPLVAEQIGFRGRRRA